MLRRPVVALALLLFPLAACGSPPASPAAPAGPTDGLAAECNPLRAEGVCLLPFPSAAFLDPDTTSPTGQRVHLTSVMFPANTQNKDFDPARLNAADGFSPSGEILAYFPELIDAASLPPITDPAKSLDAASATVIVDMDMGERVAHFSEVDVEISRAEDKQSLILRPMARLAAGHRFAVAITRSIKTLDGKVPASPPGWAAIASGSATGGAAALQAKRMPAIFGALTKAGVAQSDVILAWDFVVASDEGVTRPMRAMRDRTVQAMGDKGLGYTITSVENDFSAHTLRRVRGTFTVPKFLSQADPTVAAATLVLDDKGLPVASGTYEAPFTMILPRSVDKKAPVRLLLFGHGFLGAGESEIGNAKGSYLQEFSDTYGYALVATDWIGFSRGDELSGAATDAVGDMNLMPYISDRLHQALVNAIVLARTARAAIAHDPKLFVNGKQVIDDTRIDYYGISLGGVMGSALMGFSPDLQRGVLNVGAAGWATLVQRSTNWDLFKLVVDGKYPDKLDQQIWIDVLQAHLDSIDGMSIAPHVLADPLPGNPKKQLLLQMAVNDVQVANVATEMYARSLGLPLLDDAPLTVYALPPTHGPLPSAFTAWDVHPMPIPSLQNLPVNVPSTNDAHGQIRMLPKLMDQIDGFVRGGEVKSTCAKLCSPE